MPWADTGQSISRLPCWRLARACENAPAPAQESAARELSGGGAVEAGIKGRCAGLWACAYMDVIKRDLVLRI
jgi:hypothetical protein